MRRIVSEKALKSQLKKIQARLKKIAGFARKAMQAVNRLIQAHDISLDELEGATRGRVAKKFTKPGKRKRVSPLKGKRAPIKYRDKHGNKWSGRGMTPKWLVAAEKAGTRRETFAV